MLLFIALLSLSILVVVYAFKRRRLIKKHSGFGVWAAPVGGFDVVDWKKKKNQIPASFTRELKELNAGFVIAFLVLASGFAINATLDWLIDLID